MICIGKIVAAHGVKGFVKLKSYTEDPEAIKDYAPLYLENGTVMQLDAFSPGPKDIFLAKFKSIDDRNKAELLIGKEIFIQREQLPDNDDEEFYHIDLIRLSVEDENGRAYGKVTAIQNYGAGDFLDVRLQNGEEGTIPFTKEAVPTVDILSGKIIINPDFLVVVERVKHD